MGNGETMPVTEENTVVPQYELKRALGPLQLIGLGIGIIIGAGIFVSTGTTAANFAGPGVTISYLIAGLGCALAGLCYAEFASMIPVAGSAHSEQDHIIIVAPFQEAALLGGCAQQKTEDAGPQQQPGAHGPVQPHQLQPGPQTGRHVRHPVGVHGVGGRLIRDRHRGQLWHEQ